MNSAIVLVSGGIDSCITAAIANQECELAFLHITYGQKTQQRELQAFNEIADFYQVKHKLVCDFEHLKKIGSSSLLTPGNSSEGYFQMSSVTPYVPFRNANFLAAAVSWAEAIGIHYIFIGAVAQDAPDYPDCRPEFYETFNNLVKLGTKSKGIKIITPIIGMQKYEVIKRGIELKAPLQLTWSCYENNDLACGKCDSCVRRINAFKLTGINDPIQYA